VSFWQSVAARYANRPQVIFDLFNEPIPNDNANDNTDASAAASWQCWRDGSASGACTGSTASGYVGMQALVTAVRGTGATNVIMIGGIQWANTIWSSSTRNILTYKPADPLNNLVASLHIYQNTWCNTVSCFNAEVAPVAAQMPVVAAEIGNTNCDATFMNTVMNWLDGKQLGYLAWVWNNYGATSCANIMLVLDYTGTPSVYGQIYKAHLALLP
jgi:endoglucanase